MNKRSAGRGLRKSRLSLKAPDGHTHVNGNTHETHTEPNSVAFAEQYCEDSLISSRTEYLAQLMIHEAMHYRESVLGSPINDNDSGGSSGPNNVSEDCREADGD